MKFTLKCIYCGEERCFSHPLTNYIKSFLEVHSHTGNNVEIFIYNSKNEAIFIHQYFLDRTQDFISNASKIAEWIAERMDEVNNSLVDFERREQIEKMLTFYSDVEEKNCKDSPVSSAYMFHRGRQLLAIDILKSINFIFEQGK